MYSETKELYDFGPFRLDVEEHTLTRNDGSKSGLLPEKAFQTLCILVQRRGRLLTKQELLADIWPDSFVEENNLDKCIHAIRQVLGEKPGEQKYIQTVRKHGYRFVAAVETPHKRLASILDSTFLNEREANTTVADRAPDLIREAFALGSGYDPQHDEAVAPAVAGSKPSRRVILFTVGFASAIFLLVILSFNFRATSSASPNKITSIAVLPLKPLTADNRDPGYELGIADSLIFKISSAKGIIVRSLSETSQYADMEQDPLAAGREKKVDYVLASNYQIANGKIRITSQLINVQTGQVEGSFKVEQENSAIFAVQDAVAANIGGPLLKKLGRDSIGLSEKRYTTNDEAYRLYLQGTILAGQRTQESSRKAVEYLEKAVELDSNYALAYARLAHAYDALIYTGGTKNGLEDYLKEKAAIEKALAIDPDLAEAHSYLGEMKLNQDGDLAGAEREQRLGVELNPNSSTAHAEYAVLLAYLGRSDEAITEVKTAIDLEPALADNHHKYGFILWMARRCDEAIIEEERVVERDPETFFSYNVLTNCYHLKGDDDHAIEAFLHMNSPEETDELKAIYARSGWRGISEHELEDWKAAEKRGKRNYNQLAFHSIDLGQNEEALAYLEKALVEDPSALVSLKVNPRYDPLRSDPRFDDLLRRVGLN